MIEDREKVKEMLLKLKDENGKFVVTDDMPEDIKNTLNFMNENGVDIYSDQPIADFDDEAAEAAEAAYETTPDTDDVALSSVSPEVSTTPSTHFEETDTSVEELEDIF